MLFITCTAAPLDNFSSHRNSCGHVTTMPRTVLRIMDEHRCCHEALLVRLFLAV